LSRLIIISNRLPVTIDKKAGELIYYPSAGGLATGLNSLSKDIEKIWVGWPGRVVKDEEERKVIRQELAKDKLYPVFLSKKDVEYHYEGFSNKTIWPHFHYFTQYTTYNDEYWAYYKKVNQLFFEAIQKNLQPDDTVWVHDYQLLLLPQLIRNEFPDISIGFFLHIPFPSYEIFRILPWREQLLEGMLGADLIGFHTYGYMRHFLSATYRIGGYEHHFGRMIVNERPVNVDVFPMGIDYNKYAQKPPESDKPMSLNPKKLKKHRKLILSIDRLDYTKGIPQRLKAFEKLVAENPQYINKIKLALIVVPSRSNVDQYQELKDEVSTLVGQINGEYGTYDWVPVQYFYRSFQFDDLIELYRAADIAMITPLRDGMNLVAKEYIASKEDNKEGVLILSEMAGASDELTDAILINPQDINDMVEALKMAIDMPLEEQKERLIKLQKILTNYNIEKWTTNFLTELNHLGINKKTKQINLLEKENLDNLKKHYASSNRRLIMLDYDGTLMNFNNDPLVVIPDKSILDILQKLIDDPKNLVVINSGRDRNFLEKHLGHLNVDMAAEHGVWNKRNDVWKVSTGLTSNWKADIRSLLETMKARTPGSEIEEKDYSIAWHYRKIEKDLGQKRIREFRDVIQYLTSNLGLQVLEGNRVVEFKNAVVNKGKATSKWLNKHSWDFMLAIGDDQTDEDIFDALPEEAHTIKVGIQQTNAKYNLLTVENVREFLDGLS